MDTREALIDALAQHFVTGKFLQKMAVSLLLRFALIERGLWSILLARRNVWHQSLRTCPGCGVPHTTAPHRVVQNGKMQKKG
jgi:hypothetical protein